MKDIFKWTNIMETLVLNKGWIPMHKIPWQRAMVLAFLGKVEILQEHDRTVHTNSLGKETKAPKVIRLLSFNSIPKHNRILPLTKRNLYNRDGGVCGYCLVSLSTNSATVDHVIPTSRGGKNHWENVVLSCKRCNTKKDNKTPREAGMPIKIRPPYTPSQRDRWITDYDVRIGEDGEFIFDF